MIQNARMKRKRRDSDDGDGSLDADEDIPEVSSMKLCNIDVLNVSYMSAFNFIYEFINLIFCAKQTNLD
jgi:hypothetical protein